MKRRDFLNRVAVGALGAMAARTAKADNANDRVVVGVMGIRGRGDFLAKEFAKRGDVELRYLADPDSRLFESLGKGIEAITGKAPACV